MNTNLNIQYQGLLNRNIGTNIETDDLTVTNLTVTGSATVDNNLTVTGLLTATANPLSVVTNSEAVYTNGISSGNYIIPLVSISGGSGYRTLYNDVTLTYSRTDDRIVCGKARFYNGEWITDTPSLVLGDTSFYTSTVNQGIIEMIGSATQSYLLEVSPTGNFEVYLKTSGTPVIVYQINSTDFELHRNIDLTSGNTYKINNITQTFLNELTTTATSTITHTFVNPNLQSNINNLSVTSGLIAANAITTTKILDANVTNVKLANSSITLGTNTMSLGTTTTLLNGGTNSTTYITIVSLIPAGISYGMSATNNFKVDQVLRIGDCIIQNDDNDTYIDCFQSGTGIYAQLPKINIGTITPLQTVNLGGSINYLSGQFNNIVKFSLNPMTHSTALPFVTTNWLPIGHTATSSVLEASITIRSNLSAVRITVNIPLSNWGTTASNKHMTVCRNTTAAVYGVLQTTALLNNNYGMWHHLSGASGFETIHFSWVDTTTLTQGVTYYYSVCGRGNSAIITPINLGNSNYSEITLEELY